MAFIVSKLSSKEGKTRKLYYIARAYREKLSGKSKRRILFSLGLSDNLDTALSYRKAQGHLIIEKLINLEKDFQLADKGILPNLMHYPRNIQMRIVLQEVSTDEMELEEIKNKITELKQLKAEFPECSARHTP